MASKDEEKIYTYRSAARFWMDLMRNRIDGAVHLQPTALSYILWDLANHSALRDVFQKKAVPLMMRTSKEVDHFNFWVIQAVLDKVNAGNYECTLPKDRGSLSNYGDDEYEDRNDNVDF